MRISKKGKVYRTQFVTVFRNKLKEIPPTVTKKDLLQIVEDLLIKELGEFNYWFAKLITPALEYVWESGKKETQENILRKLGLSDELIKKIKL